MAEQSGSCNLLKANSTMFRSNLHTELLDDEEMTMDDEEDREDNATENEGQKMAAADRAEEAIHNFTVGDLCGHDHELR